jgi:hypothetical protein
MALVLIWASAAWRHKHTRLTSDAPVNTQPMADAPVFSQMATMPAQSASSTRPERSRLMPAQVDPFAPPPPPAPPTIPKKAAPPPPPPPQAPPLTVRVVGRFQQDDSPAAVYAQEGSVYLSLTQGQLLPSGYMVRKISDAAVEFTHPLLTGSVLLPLPPSPKQEIR